MRQAVLVCIAAGNFVADSLAADSSAAGRFAAADRVAVDRAADNSAAEKPAADGMHLHDAAEIPAVAADKSAAVAGNWAANTVVQKAAA